MAEKSGTIIKPEVKKQPERICSTCKFGIKGRSPYGLDCHRYAPAIPNIDAMGQNKVCEHPIVEPGDWCGDHKFPTVIPKNDGK